MIVICCTLSASDWIEIINIVITSALGLWIAIGIQRNLTKSRYLKEYFISELTSIRDEYKIFINELFVAALSATEIKDRLKILSMRINNIDDYIHKRYKLENTPLKDAHTAFQQYITGEDSFNDQFREATVAFNSSIKNEILRRNTDIVNAITQRIMDINEAKAKRTSLWKRICG